MNERKGTGAEKESKTTFWIPIQPGNSGQEEQPRGMLTVELILLLLLLLSLLLLHYYYYFNTDYEWLTLSLFTNRNAKLC